MSSYLVSSLSEAHRKQLCKQFESLKAPGSSSKNNMFFGKDSLYDEPQLDGYGRILHHVHMLPIHDDAAHQRWLSIFRRRGEKTSDKALIYAANEQGDFLLIYILDEPGAHERARKDQMMMKAFYRLAIAFRAGELEAFEKAA